jgi:hypothetical protein
MSYSAFGPPFGLVAAPTVPTKKCGPNTTFNPVDNECVCNIGFTSQGATSGCIPINIKESCPPGENQFRSPIDRRCGCPPGHDWNPDPSRTECIPIKWFPDCKDIHGNKIPNCIFGMRMTDVAPFAIGGAVAGLAVGVLFSALLR